MARRFNSIESTADQAEAMVQQGRWVDAERQRRALDIVGDATLVQKKVQPPTSPPPTDPATSRKMKVQR